MSFRSLAARFFISLSVIPLSMFQAALAQDRSAETFYAGKTITLVLGYPPGGANDTFGRLVVRYLGQFIPGTPRIILQHMPGAGSATAANYIFNAAPRDGTVLGLLVPTIALEERMGVPSVKYKSGEFSWIGRLASAPNITFLWHTSKVKDIKEAFDTESTLAATGSSATNAIYPAVLNRVVGTKFKMVMGYQGSAAAMVAMERGEIEGHSPTLDTLTSLHPDWIEQKRVNIVVQYLLRRHPDMSDVPTAVELARNEQQRQVLEFAVSAGDIGKYIISTPGLANHLKEALRKAFDQMVSDPQFQDEARQQRVGLAPMSGAELEQIVRGVANAAPEVAGQLKSFYPH